MRQFRDGTSFEHDVVRFRRRDEGVQEQASIGECQESLDQHATEEGAWDLEWMREVANVDEFRHERREVRVHA